jgi:hypothetical protein
MRIHASLSLEELRRADAAAPPQCHSVPYTCTRIVRIWPFGSAASFALRPLSAGLAEPNASAIDASPAPQRLEARTDDVERKR